jgi:hypothetical protein
MDAVNNARLDRSAFEIVSLDSRGRRPRLLERQIAPGTYGSAGVDAADHLLATIRLPPDFKEFLRLLNSNKVGYLVIGGYAVNYHGFSRATADLDIWIAITPDNAQRVWRARFASSALCSPAQTRSWNHAESFEWVCLR